MRPFCGAVLAALTLSGAGSAATLTITPDRQTYRVGDTITLSVLGDSEGAAVNDFVHGRILFDPGLADFVASHQEPLTTNGSSWAVGRVGGGVGFADAFDQFKGEPDPVDGPLLATVMLLATAPGILDYSWESDLFSDTTLVFFGLTTAPGGSVAIVPEPSTGALVGLAIVATAAARRAARRMALRRR